MRYHLLVLATLAGVGFAGAASAMSFQVSMPLLTFPPQPAPETTQSCTDLIGAATNSCAAATR